MVEIRIGPQTLRTANTCAGNAQRCGLRPIELTI